MKLVYEKALNLTQTIQKERIMSQKKKMRAKIFGNFSDRELSPIIWYAIVVILLLVHELLGWSKRYGSNEVF